MNRNLFILILSQVFGFTAATVTVFISGIIGSDLSSIKTLSTLPPSIYVVGTAAATIFAAKIMSIIGRRLGFIFASVAGSISCLIGAYAIIIESFFIFCFAKFILGATMAFTHQYRFAAAESVEKEKAPKAISSLLLAGIVAAFLGIGLANYTKNFVSDYLYVGSYLTLAVLTLIPSFLLFFFKDIREISFVSNKENNSRNYSEFFSDPKFLQAITSAAFAYAVMSFLMTATPISMHIVHQLSLEKTGIVLQFHVLAMFLPSLVTGNLIKKFGYSNMMYLGVLFYFFTILLSFFQPSFLNYFISLIFLGIGWNFLFISGTSLLVTTYKPDEKFKAQGFNDLLVFSSMALASLLAGILISIASWKTVNLFCIPFLILIILSIVNADKKR
tara:strand:- start:9 stop:1172 length:1164 start_codon:yes stop_codon:yes gene_type:complete